MKKEYIVKFKVFDMFMQEVKEDQVDFYPDAAEATYAYLEKCGRCMDNNCKLEFKDEDNNGYMEEHYSNGRFLIILELNI